MRYLGNLTISGGAGLKTYNIGFQPTWITMTVCEKVGGDTISHKSEGKVLLDSTYTGGFRQRCQSTCGDNFSINSSAHCVQHYEAPGVKVLSASFDSITATGFKLNADITNTN